MESFILFGIKIQQARVRLKIMERLICHRWRTKLTVHGPSYKIEYVNVNRSGFRFVSVESGTHDRAAVGGGLALEFSSRASPGATYGKLTRDACVLNGQRPGQCVQSCQRCSDFCHPQWLTREISEQKEIVVVSKGEKKVI